VFVIDATRYARPHVVFDDGHSHRVILECKVLQTQRRKRKKTGGEQWVFASTDAHLDTLLVITNAPPIAGKGEEFMTSWVPFLEALSHRVPLLAVASTPARPRRAGEPGRAAGPGPASGPGPSGGSGTAPVPGQAGAPGGAEEPKSEDEDSESAVDWMSAEDEAEVRSVDSLSVKDWQAPPELRAYVDQCSKMYKWTEEALPWLHAFVQVHNSIYHMENMARPPQAAVYYLPVVAV